MAYTSRRSKSKNSNAVGSIYFNLPKDASKEAKQDLAELLEVLKEAKGYLSISLQGSKLESLEENDKGYVSLRAFANGFKQKTTDSDYYIVPQEALDAPKPASTGRARSSRVVVAESDDDIPFQTR